MAPPSPPPGLATLNHPYGLQEQEQSYYDLGYFFTFQPPAGFDLASADGLAWGGFELPGGSFQPAMGAPELAAFAPMYTDQYPSTDYWSPPLGGLGHGQDLPFADHPQSCFPAGAGFPSVMELDDALTRIDHGDPGQPLGAPSFSAAQHGAGMNVPPLQLAHHARGQQIRTHAPMPPPALETYGSMDECMGQPSADETPPSSPDIPSTPPRILPGVYELAGPAGPPPLLPRDDRPATPPPRRRGNEHATHTQPWGCGKCKTAFMTPHLLDVHMWFHRPKPPFYMYQNAAFQVTPPSEEKLRETSMKNQRYSSRMRCEDGKWTTFKQTMHGFGDEDEDEEAESE